MYLCVSGISHQEGESSCICVLVVMYLCVSGIPGRYSSCICELVVYQEGESSCICVLVVMYLCVNGIDCASFYDFLVDFRTVPTV
jgi:hypothetical protein